MIFTGKNLALVRDGIVLAITALRTEIGLQTGGPGNDVDEIIDEIEDEIVVYQRMLERIDRAIEKENVK